MLSKEENLLLESFADQSNLLFILGVIRTDSFTGEIGEYLASTHFNLTLTGKSTAQVDAESNLGEKYQKS